MYYDYKPKRHVKTIKGKIKPQIDSYFKTCRPPPLIAYKPDPKISKNSTDKADSLKLVIKTQLRERDSETVAIYVPLFSTGIP